MLAEFQAFLTASALSLWQAVKFLAVSALYFGFLALLVKGTDAITAARRARRETVTNLSLFALDTMFVAPVVGLVAHGIRLTISGSPLELVRPVAWDALPMAVVAVTAVFTGDFISYWRHRLEHTRLLWPSHAIHHSDTEMTWLTLNRFHPINRLTTIVVDIGCLALLGFPEWALVVHVMVRHLYGEFIHADFPWTYGPVGRIFVSPAMHRWHHARDVEGAGSNFATVFSVFDQAFGTYHVPGPCNVPLGVNDDMGKGTVGQLLYPFVAWGRRIAARVRRLGRAKQARVQDVSVSVGQ